MPLNCLPSHFTRVEKKKRQIEEVRRVFHPPSQGHLSLAPFFQWQQLELVATLHPERCKAPTRTDGRGKLHPFYKSDPPDRNLPTNLPRTHKHSMSFTQHFMKLIIWYWNLLGLPKSKSTASAPVGNKYLFNTNRKTLENILLIFSIISGADAVSSPCAMWYFCVHVTCSFTLLLYLSDLQF